MTMTPPLPYCNPAMLKALKDAKAGQQISSAMIATLRSRGWADRQGRLTEKGAQYLASRA